MSPTSLLVSVMEEKEHDGGQRPVKRLRIGGETEEEEEEAVRSSRRHKSGEKVGGW